MPAMRGSHESWKSFFLFYIYKQKGHCSAWGSRHCEVQGKLDICNPLSSNAERLFPCFKLVKSMSKKWSNLTISCLSTWYRIWISLFAFFTLILFHVLSIYIYSYHPWWIICLLKLSSSLSTSIFHKRKLGSSPIISF